MDLYAFLENKKIEVKQNEHGYYNCGSSGIQYFIYSYGFATTGKKSKLQVHNYPPEIQEEYFKTHKRIEVQPLSGRVIAIKAIGILIFTGILAVCAYAAGAEKFVEGFGIALGLLVWIGIYDTFFFGLGTLCQHETIQAGRDGTHG